MSDWRRQTLAAEVALTGNAVRTHGGLVQLRLLPGEDGIAFWRDDLEARLPADLDHLVPTPNATTLGRQGRAELHFVEHVLSALSGLGITDAEVHVEGPEVPLFDGSAQPIVEALDRAGVQQLGGSVEPLRLAEPVVIDLGNRRIEATPAVERSVAYHLDHVHPLIGSQTATVRWPDYRQRVAPARTFATQEELEQLAKAGLIAGGSEDNLLVVYADRLSAPLYEPAGMALHKVLDVIGDLALVGRPVLAAVRAQRTGHSENQGLARALAALA